jgi:hypothetical protein
VYVDVLLMASAVYILGDVYIASTGRRILYYFLFTVAFMSFDVALKPMKVLAAHAPADEGALHAESGH